MSSTFRDFCQQYLDAFALRVQATSSEEFIQDLKRRLNPQASAQAPASISIQPQQAVEVLSQFTDSISTWTDESVMNPELFLEQRDRRNMVLKIYAHLREIGLQGVTVQKRSLYSIMQRPLPAVDAETEAELVALETLFEQ